MSDWWSFAHDAGVFSAEINTGTGGTPTFVAQTIAPSATGVHVHARAVKVVVTYYLVVVTRSAFSLFRKLWWRSQATPAATQTRPAAAMTDTSVILFSMQVDEDTPPTTWVRTNMPTPQQIAMSHFHFVAVGAAGVYSWGRGGLGVLGHGGEEDETSPRLIKALEHEDVRAVAAGTYHSAALTAEGRLLTWGWVPFAPTEDGIQETFSRVPRPVPFGYEVRIAGVACGCFATAAWDVHGQLHTWGRNDSGQLGHGIDQTETASPRHVVALSGVPIAQVAFGGTQSADELTGFMLARSAGGVLFSCGAPAHGCLGRPFSSDDAELTSDPAEAWAAVEVPLHFSVPGAVLFGPEDDDIIVDVSAADIHAAALTASGTAYVWGSNSTSLLGLEASAPDAYAPLELSELPPCKRVVTNAFSTAFLTHGNALLLVGGDAAAGPAPRLAGLPGSVDLVFGGGLHLCVMLEDPHAVRTLARAAHELGAPARQAVSGLPQEMVDLLTAEPDASATALQLRHELRCADAQRARALPLLGRPATCHRPPHSPPQDSLRLLKTLCASSRLSAPPQDSLSRCAAHLRAALPRTGCCASC